MSATDQSLLDRRRERVDLLERRVAELEGKLAEFLCRLSSVADELESRADLYAKGEVNDTEWRIQRTRGLAAGSRDAAGLIRTALSDPAPPSVQALTRLVEAAVQARPYARFTLELRDAVDAYQAARSGRGEGE